MIINKAFRSFLENRYLSWWVVLVIDLFIVSTASSVSYAVVMQIYRNLGVIKHPEFHTYFLITFTAGLFSFLLLKTYIGIIRYSTIHEVRRIFSALTTTGLLVFCLLYSVLGLSGSVSLAYCSLFFLIGFGGLFLFRTSVVIMFQQLIGRFGTFRPVPVYIWDADKQDLSFAQLTNASHNRFIVKGFIVKQHHPEYRQLTGLPVLKIETPDDILCHSIENVLFTDAKHIKRNTKYIEKMLEAGIRIYIVQLKNIECIKTLDDALINHVRPLQIEDLLSRPEIMINPDEINKCISGKIILVTGAAGSIGSEIVRQLAGFTPKCVVCFDQAETPLNDLHIELSKKYPYLEFVSVIGDIRDSNSLRKLFSRFKPDIVYHAAAYKHVPMMERFPEEAIMTNVNGTKNLVDLSLEYGIGKFIMVSTDKAVNPTNIMGASKRIAEIYTQSAALHYQKIKPATKFITTRFGNVLGSNGSVIPLFKKQIESGGPLTVTHPDITRYFMTIPEACRLVLEASHIGESGHIYVFDMGEPMKILDMATKMIELAGLKPYEDIKIEFSGLRAGEKLYEELLSDSETTIPTSHNKVLIAKARKYDFNCVLPLIEKLIRQAGSGNHTQLVGLMKELVPEFINKNEENKSLDESMKILFTT